MSERVTEIKRQRGVFGWLFVLLLIAFNLAVAYGFYKNLTGAGAGTKRGEDGIVALVMVWVMGDIILGLLVLLTKGKTVITKRTRR
jgi:hypothetical protein